MVYDIFSKRQRYQRGEMSDIFQYQDFNAELKVQIWFEFENQGVNAQRTYMGILQILRRERGKRRLADIRQRNTYGIDSSDELDFAEEELYKYFLSEQDAEKALDVVELYCRLANKTSNIDRTIANINVRFKESGFGYQIENYRLIRFDSTFSHEHVIKPALWLLRAEEFQSANEEFLLAHEHFRHDAYEDCIVNCHKSFETTMKIIARSRGWELTETNNSSHLVKLMFESNLIPSFLQSQFSALRSCLLVVSTVRNRAGGHGRGDKPPPPSYLARFLLQQTAANIILLIEANNSFAEPVEN